MEDIKAQFLLDRDVTFLNNGSYGACPRVVFEAYQAWQLELERQPVAFLGRRFPELMYEARAALAEFLGAQPDDLVFVSNATTAGNTVARSIRLEPGDEILATDLEYGAMDRMWEHLTAAVGATYRKVHVPLPIDESEAFADRIWKEVTDKTRLIFMSHITSSTGLVLPIEDLISKARAAGILTFVDGAHAPGQIDLNLESLDADFYTGNCHKWLFAPKGAAFLWVCRTSQPLIEPLVVSWGNLSAGNSTFIQENEYQGTRDIAPYLAVPDGIRFYHENDWGSIARRCRSLALEVRSMFSDVIGGPPLAPESWYAQLVGHEVAAVEPREMQRRLYDQFRVEIPISQLRDRWFIRASIQGFNDAADIDVLRDALEVCGTTCPETRLV